MHWRMLLFVQLEASRNTAFSDGMRNVLSWIRDCSRMCAEKYHLRFYFFASTSLQLRLAAE